MPLELEKEFKDLNMPRLKKKNLIAWIKEVAATHGKKVGTLSYLFCTDEHILEVNKEFLQHDYYTDIITFDNTERDRIAGDIVVSIDTVRSNSEQFNTEFRQELLRVIIHGVLHLCGINDKGEGEREIMEKHENAALEIASKYDLMYPDKAE
ncbi:MAG: rRNA maturation RNase YbeY [Paludibacteraceae bacterium]|nr:rRNA maturation RNase YbeY [Paludibacteraceae bacterium]